jgi:hypothetical protein
MSGSRRHDQRPLAAGRLAEDDDARHCSSSRATTNQATLEHDSDNSAGARRGAPLAGGEGKFYTGTDGRACRSISGCENMLQPPFPPNPA